MQTSLQSAGQLVGEQNPRLRLLPDVYDPILSADRADDMVGIAEIAGLYLDPWQQIGAESLTLTRADGRWAAFEAFVAANRQQGKGTIIEARQLAGLFVWEETLQVYTAHEFKTAQEMFLRIRQLVEATPELDRLVQRIRTADGEEAIETKNGCRLKFMARSSSSGRGFTAPTLYLDEAMKLKRRMQAAIMPTMSALSLNQSTQLMYFSSAGEQDSEVQESVRERALSGESKRLVYVEWSVPRWDELSAADRAPWPSPAEYRADPEIHRRANPGWNIRLDPDFVVSEIEAMGPEQFDRERLGIWAKIGGDGVIPVGDWLDAAGDPLEVETAARECGRIAFGVDIPPARDSATISLAADLGDGKFAVFVVDRREGVVWVPDRLAELKEAWNPIACVFDELAATGTLVPEVRRAKVRPLLIKTRELGIACARFYDSVVTPGPDGEGRVLVHTGQKELTDAVKSAGKKTMGSDSVWKWARTGEADIAPLISATLALHVLQSRKKTTKTAGSGGRMIVMG
ncbi:hypothetical protein [Mycetocola saprophilus]|uniref:hypothetical protein n=1 Tax=Mycetocola saprophilus TaxID=76636 RepID=UPI00069147D7|nr:hypothetical protein [Mycetocola saprophilus]